MTREIRSIRPFLSHKREDAEAVLLLKEHLSLYGAGGWKDTDDLLLGGATPTVLRRIIEEETGGFVWWGTPCVLESRVINSVEIPAAMTRAATDPGYPVVPLFVELSPGADRVRIVDAMGEWAEDFLDRNGVVRFDGESLDQFVDRTARRYVHDAILTLPPGPVVCAFRVLGEGPVRAGHLQLDWRTLFDGPSRRPGENAIGLMVDVLSVIRSSLQQRGHAPLVEVDSDLPLPLACVVGYEWRLTTRMRVQVMQRTGNTFSLVDTSGEAAPPPAPTIAELPGSGPVVVVASTGSQIEGAAHRYALEKGARRLAIFHCPGFLSDSEIRGLALAITKYLGELNDEGLEKHLLVRGPAALAFAIGVGYNARGSMAMPFWDGSSYVAPLVVGDAPS